MISSISFLLLKNCQNKNSQEKQQENIAKNNKRNTRSSAKDKANRLSGSGDYLNYSGVGSSIGCYGPVIKEMTSFDPPESHRRTTNISTNTAKTTVSLFDENKALLELNDTYLPIWPEEDVPGPETRIEISDIENIVSFKTAKPAILEENIKENFKNDDQSEKKIAKIKPHDVLEGVIVSGNSTFEHVQPRNEKPPRKKSSTVSA